MHEELYIRENSKLKFVFLAAGLLLLPFSLFEFAVREGKTELSFVLDLPILAASLLFIIIFFEKEFRTYTRFAYPYIALLICEFLRFGSVTLFNRVIPFDIYILSAVMMALAFGFTFILSFIGIGKMRTKVPLILFAIFNYLVVILSLSFQIIPFFAYEDTVEGRFCVSISGMIVFIILNTVALIVGISFRDDKAKSERKQRKELKKRNKR